MNYKYRRGQIFGKRLNVPKYILNKVYDGYLSFNEYIFYKLDDKIPLSCVVESDKQIVEKFGIDKCKELDWELINMPFYYGYSLNFREILMSIDPQTDDINGALYELVKDRIRPIDYSSKMCEKYKNRLFDISQINDEELRSIMIKFNEGNVDLKAIIYNWELFKDKDLGYCLLNDMANKNHITDVMLKDFMSNYGALSSLIVENGDIYIFISDLSVLDFEDKQKFVKQFTDDILSNTKRRYGDYGSSINLSNEQYREIFRYSSMEEYLIKINGDRVKPIIEELKLLPPDYVFNMPFPFSELLDSQVIYFAQFYGLKNIVDFDNECGHFFSKNNCKMLELMEPIYLHYDNDRKFYTKDDKYNRPYTRLEFYEAIRRMIVYGPTDGDYLNNVPDYRDITGEFRENNADLFISEQAPSELQNLFYTKSITPQLLSEHPEYIDFLYGKNLRTCFKERKIHIMDNNSQYSYENFYDFINSRLDFNAFMNFILEYADIFDIVFEHGFDIEFTTSDDMNQIKYIIQETLRKIIIKQGLPYPRRIPNDFIERYPSMFLDKSAPLELQNAFYSRTISSDFILSNPEYRDFLNDVDLEILFKYMPVKMMTIYSSNSLSSINSDGSLDHRNQCLQINFIDALKQTFGKNDALDVMLIYGKYVELVYKSNHLDKFLYNPEFTRDEFLDELDKIILQNIIDENMRYDDSIPSHFKNNNPTLFLEVNVPDEIKEKFYKRKFTLKDFNDNPELFDIFDKTNIACGFSESMSWIIPLFNNLENLKTANYNRMKVIAAYSKIQSDYSLQLAFKEYVTEFGNDINVDKIEYAAEVLSRLSLSNSSEIFKFRKEIAREILKSDNPLDTLSKIEDVFMKNNIPTVGKVYSCFEILHPDFKGFNFESPLISPVLKKSSTSSKKVIVFSDLIKSSFGSNNRSVNAYLKNIEFGSNLYDSLKNGEIRFDSLNEADKKELVIFSNHLATLYNNTMNAKNKNEIFISSGDTLNDILELSKKLSPNGTIDYNLGDRIIRMFCGFTGIDTLDQAKNYIGEKIKTADLRNRNASNSDMILEQGDFVKGIGKITFLSNILQNGSVSKEYLGSCVKSDATPLDTDVSMVMSSDGTVKEKMNATVASSYGPIYLVLKNDDRFMTTRCSTKTLDSKRDMSKLEVFFTGGLGQDHYGIRTGFASSEINYIVMDNYDSKVGLEIALNGFYIPVANKEGKIIFTPKDYDELREKMSGLSYFGEQNYFFSENLITEETEYLAQEIEQSNFDAQVKREKINCIIKKSLEELGLQLKTNIDGDLSDGVVELIDTGSTGRGTNKPGDGDAYAILKMVQKNPIR